MTFPRLQARFEVSKGSIIKLVSILWHDVSAFGFPAFYVFALSSFTGIAWVLFILFVLETVESSRGDTKIVNVALSSDVIGLQDICASYLTAANCTYDLAASALNSQLITHDPYAVAGVSFVSPNGTGGIPYGILKDFANQAGKSAFGDERATYYLPVLDAQQFICHHDADSTRAAYNYEASLAAVPIYTITIDPNTTSSRIFVRQNIQNGVMAVAQSLLAPQTTIITASDNYADILSQLIYGKNSTSKSDVFTAICTLNTHSSG